MAKPEQPKLLDHEGCEGESWGAMRDSHKQRKAPWAANGFGSTFFHKKVEMDIRLRVCFLVTMSLPKCDKVLNGKKLFV